MAIPDYQTIMMPLLKLISDGQLHNSREVIDKLADEFSLTDLEKDELLPSGQQAIFDNRVGWAKTYLKKAGLLESPRRGVVKITDRGMEVLKRDLKSIDSKFLEEFPEFVEFKTLRSKIEGAQFVHDEIDTGKTPEELLDYSYANLRQDLGLELLEKIKSCSPKFFESLVIDLLLKMGYGGTRKDAGEAVGRSGDGGIDGIIKEDKLGLDIIYVQAKRWENQVAIKEIRDFAGSLLGKKAKKGIFITTSNFPQGAYEYVAGIEHKIILIDGKRLADLMIEHNVGVSVLRAYEVKKVDSDYFSEE